MVEIAVALITLAGVILTVAFGNKKTEKSIKANTDLTIYRIGQLEKRLKSIIRWLKEFIFLKKKTLLKKKKLRLSITALLTLNNFTNNKKGCLL